LKFLQNLGRDIDAATEERWRISAILLIAIATAIRQYSNNMHSIRNDQPFFGGILAMTALSTH